MVEHPFVTCQRRRIVARERKRHYKALPRAQEAVHAVRCFPLEAREYVAVSVHRHADAAVTVLSELRQRRTIRRHLGQRDSLRRV